MIVGRYRTHKVNVEKYESMEYGGSVKIDTEVDTEFKDMSIEEIAEELGVTLDELLDKETQRIVELGGNVDQSHIIDFYEVN